MSAQGAMNVRNKVSDLQTKLFHAAKQKLDRKKIPEAEVRDQTRGIRRAYGNLVVRLGVYQFGRLAYFNDNGY